jgi:capsular polysaccharide biosynthesis protein
VDFWDITKLLVRRWTIMVPLLLVSVALGVLAMTKVQPDYDATAHVQLVPPVAGASTPGQATADQRNPWIGLGLQTIGNAGIVTITDLSVTDELHREGLSDSYTVVMTEGSPLINFEIVGKSPEQATATTDELISRFDKTITSLQTSYGVPQSDLITTHRLDLGTNVKKSTSKIKRAAIGVAGAGVLLTVAVTVGADAWLKRRSRGRAGAVGAGAGEDLGTQRPGRSARPRPA